MAEERSLIWKSLQALARILTTVFFDLKTYGRENVPTRGGALLVANHQSYLDPIVVAVRFRRPVSFMAKSELFTNRYFGWLIRKLHAYPVRQGEGDVGAVREMIRQVNGGRLINIYPEGTRTPNGELQAIEKGVALIIRKSDAPVIPVAIDGSFEAWSRKGGMFRSHPVRVMYGKPMNLKGLKADQIIKEIERSLRELIAALRAKRD